MKYVAGRRSDLLSILEDEKEVQDFTAYLKKLKNSVLTLHQLN